MTGYSIFRGTLAHLTGDPARMGHSALHTFEDGVLLVEGGHVKAVGAFDGLKDHLPRDVPVTHFKNGIIVPGFVDTHIHFPQADIVGAYGAQLLDWLQTYTYPAEARFADEAHAQSAAAFFLDELLRQGTTAALVFGTVHKEAIDALFAEALIRNMRMIGGKVLMDRGAPRDLLDGPDKGRAATEALIQSWHGRGRLGYAVTPRFAPACSAEQLTLAGDLLRAYPEVHLHTHLSENREEIDLVAKLFPGHADYLDVYDAHGLVGDRSVFAHGVHLDGGAFARMAAKGGAIAFCPSSNLFLGSGLFDLAGAKAHGLRVGLGTDVGAGTRFSLLHTMGEAYKVGQLRGRALDPLEAFYLSTLGGAAALGLEAKIGNLAPGKEADFVVLDIHATPLLERRLTPGRSFEETIFALSILGDDRVVARTYIAGKLAHERKSA